MRELSTASDFWNDNAAASSVLKKISLLEKEIDLWKDLGSLDLLVYPHPSSVLSQ